NNLKRIALAMQEYQDQHGRLPPAAVYDTDGRPLYSWRGLLLPHLEQADLYNEFRLDEPWDSPHNIGLLPRMPKVYQSPSLYGVVHGEPGTTFYQVIVGPGAAFEGKEGFRLSKEDFPDGTSNTFLVVEAGTAVPWTKPADLVYDPEGPLPEFGGVSSVRAPLSGSKRVTQFKAALADGSVRYFAADLTQEQTLRATITRNGGEKVEE